MADAEKDPVWIRVTVAIVLRLLWFSAGFTLTLLLLLRSPGTFDGWKAVFGCSLAVGLAGAIFGPRLHEKERLMGRGAMDEVKRNSRPPKPKR